MASLGLLKKRGRTDRQTNRIANYIIVRYEVWTVVLGLEAPYWLSYGQFGSAQKKGPDKQTNRIANYIIVRSHKGHLREENHRSLSSLKSQT